MGIESIFALRIRILISFYKIKIDKINEFKCHINNKNIPKQTLFLFDASYYIVFMLSLVTNVDLFQGYIPHCLVYQVHLRYRHHHHQPEYILFVNFVVNVLMSSENAPAFLLFARTQWTFVLELTTFPVQVMKYVLNVQKK